MSVIDRSRALLALYGQVRQFARYSVGRLTGTTTAADGRYLFALDLAETKRFQRAETNAVIGILLKKGVFTSAEWSAQLEEELRVLVEGEKVQWPEVKPAEDGRSYSLDVVRAAERLKAEKWPP